MEEQPFIGPARDAAIPLSAATAQAVGGSPPRGKRSAPSCRLAVLMAATATMIGCTWIADALRASDIPVVAPPRFAVVPPTAGIAAITPIERHRLPVPAGKASSHASSLIAVPRADGGADIVAFWYAGSRESAPDVEIVSSTYDARKGRWGEATIVLNRHDLAESLGFAVRRLGNPVGWTDPEGQVHLFVVATGAGGWAASRVVHLVSSGENRAFWPLRVLPLSPWFNTSSLVRAPATALQDGGALLPLYFEVGNKYPLALRISAAGQPVSVVRMSQDDEALQPTIVPLDELRGIALLRDHGDSRRMKAVATEDGGSTWTRTISTGVRNPGSAIVGLRLPDGTLAAIVNPSPDARNELVLKRSIGGQAWRVAATLARGDTDDEFSYPSAVIVGDRLHVTFTANRTAIEHQVFRLEPAR